jgi:hypothetical protein
MEEQGSLRYATVQCWESAFTINTLQSGRDAS